MVAQALIKKVTQQIAAEEAAMMFPEYWGIGQEKKPAKKRGKDPLRSMKAGVNRIERAFNAFFDSALAEAEDCNEFLGSTMRASGGLLHLEH